MSAELSLTDLNLLSLCAILRVFNNDLLLAFEQYESTSIAGQIASDWILSMAEPSGMYCLRDDIQALVLAKLRDEHPGDEILLHERCFAVFLARMHQPTSPESRLIAEERCFYHLEALRLPLIERRDWHRLRQLVDAVRTARPQQERHIQRLSLYDGLVAIHTQNYESGEAILNDLLTQANIEDEVRMRASTILAHAQWFQTNYDRALELHHKVHTLAVTIEHHAFQGHALLNMSMIYHELGDFAQALSLSEQSLHQYEAVGDVYLSTHARYEVGKNAMQLGRWHDAQVHFAEAASSYERLHVQAQLANLCCLQGMLHHALGHESQSEMWYRRSLEISQVPEHSNTAVTMDAWLLLGLLYQTQGQWPQALDAIESAARLARDLRNTHSTALTHFRRGDIYKAWGRSDAAIEEYQEAIVLLETMRGAAAVEDVKLGLLGATQQIYEAMVLLCLDLGRPAEAFHYVERARSRAFLDTLAKKSPELYDALDHSVVTLADAQAGLPAGALLLEYYTTGVLPSGEHMLNSIPDSNTRLREHLTLPPQIVLFAITRDHAAVHRLALDPNHLRPPEGDRYPGRHLLHGRLPQYLYAQLVAPAADLLAGHDLLYLIPHGPLHYVPFTALRSTGGEYLLRAGGPALAHAPSATILLRNCLGRPPARGSAALALGFNDPQGDQPLLYAEAEAEHVARILGGQAWVGPDPKSERLIAAGRSLRWLHIAGHARFEPRDPLGSALSLGSDDALSARAIIRDLDLSADLVTLSSCTSGVSHVVPGDELLGLQRALLYAGAPAVVCTRWEARDLVALLVMDHFYSALQQGQPPGAALRDAQVAVRELSGQELAARLERWNAEQYTPTIALDTPAAARQLVRALAAELGDLDLDAIRDSWRGAAPDLANALGQPVVQGALDERPFADPLFWAPFMLVGRA
jgi:CHAT domain-containing protein/tetratricopeptide (TPR) repeat protein